MALQTEKSTSTGAATATASPPPPDNTPFSPAGSPPLILAFLAIGLFAGAMILVFGFRRIQLGRSFRLGGMPQDYGGSGPENEVPPSKPQLWEVESFHDATWSQIAGYGVEKSTGHDGHWANMLPLAANAVSTKLNPLPEDSKPHPPAYRQAEALGIRTLRESSRQMLSMWPHWHPLPQRDDIPRAENGVALEKADVPVSKTLQVGVAIIMPSPQYPIYIKRRTDSGYYEKERRPTTDGSIIPDYSIGLYERAWD